MYLWTLFLPLFSSIISNFSNFFNKKITILFSIFFMFFSVLTSFFIFFEIIYCNSISFIKLVPWIQVYSINIYWSFLFDSITSIMLIIVNFISFLVHLYSIEYMWNDPHLCRFFSFLSLFTFFMLILVTAPNLIQMFLGWEGVGLSSYLLINFWFTRYEANKSAIKAIIVNKIGDIGIYLFIISIFNICNSIDYSIIFSLNFIFDFYFFYIFDLKFISLNLICFFLFLGCIAKSAQLGLHSWLPDAMEGPTPVSALIHAATMVTAGVFLIIRCSPLLEYSNFILLFISFLGAFTAFFSGTVGIFQHDIKKVIAYSTCSQLGYMIFCCGISNYSLAFFHLFNHAFFKALLFLSAGSVIHAMNDEQDMRKFGGLIKFLPYTYSMFLIGSLSLMGFPFLTGFYSKDIILEVSYSNINILGLFTYWLGLFSAFLTSFYSTRLIFYTFINKPKNSKINYFFVHEPFFFMSLPLFILSIFSIFIGYFMKDLFIGLGTNIWNGSIISNSENILMLDSEFLSFFIKLYPFFFSLFGIYLFYYFFYNLNIYFFFYLNKLYIYYIFFNQKWLFDNIYNLFIVDFIFFFSYSLLFKIIDRGYIEFFGPLGIQRFFNKSNLLIKYFFSGYIYHYILIILFFLLMYLYFIFFDIYYIYFLNILIYIYLNILK